MSSTAQVQRPDKNKSGQVLGQKGASTRNRIIEVAERLLAESQGIPPPVAAIAREAGISPPTFYLYFADLGEVILAVVRKVGSRLDPVIDLAREDWPADELFDRAERFVTAYFDYWGSNAYALRARNRLADEGDVRFQELRVAATLDLLGAIAAKIADPAVPGGRNCPATAMAAPLITAIERHATTVVLDLYPAMQVARKDAVSALTNLVAVICGGGTRAPA